MSARHRVAGLDGLRGLLALYVVVHHCWLICFPGYPANTGPAWGGWLIHGRLAVVAFIVLSGFSLAIAPARDGWRLGGGWRFAGRRARRILPAYWAALLVSLVLAAVAGPLPMSHAPSWRTVVVYGLMLQDFVAVPAPNGAFWSIAVEAALYVAFPLLLLVMARCGPIVTLAVACLPMVLAGPGAAIGYTWEMAPLFTMGMVAAGVATRAASTGRRGWWWLSGLAGAPVLAVILGNGPVWTARHYFWVDLASGPAIALLLVAIATGRRDGFLTSRPMTLLGNCSYSLYLMHVPVIALVALAVGTTSFLLLVALAAPAAVLTATMFAALFERPFLSPGRDRAGEAGTVVAART
ncbi:hypothetical protein Acy02nite_02180 [Actinoplanes cyaneus]|uniref:Acyltransferase 3 domain-containing protein n=1 Tax=Actinoplanes cyaneus TaxID=52696 RepID=A0A919IBB6_9ACTN|nr:acyltransferase [Actinoplanes cyaneus]MCW2143575.1 Peptidoglycan/LPS O-acetylase OafA/YrhL, contains acyltransferase and SGNH-hydrolase domains [Actinoplanes cyaneus]GID62337.1 hypothetical protein Acy02nite_02180 [Actinoplanes cyaneus]